MPPRLSQRPQAPELLTMEQLKKQLKQHKLPLSGNKKTLVERLADHLARTGSRQTRSRRAQQQQSGTQNDLSEGQRSHSSPANHRSSLRSTTSRHGRQRGHSPSTHTSRDRQRDHRASSHSPRRTNRRNGRQRDHRSPAEQHRPITRSSRAQHLKQTPHHQRDRRVIRPCRASPPRLEHSRSSSYTSSSSRSRSRSAQRDSWSGTSTEDDHQGGQLPLKRRHHGGHRPRDTKRRKQQL